MNKAYLEYLFSIKFEAENQKKESISLNQTDRTSYGENADKVIDVLIEDIKNEIENRIMAIDILIDKYLELHK